MKVSQMEPLLELSLPALLQWEHASPCSFTVDRKYRKYSCSFVFVLSCQIENAVFILNELIW